MTRKTITDAVGGQVTTLAEPRVIRSAWRGRRTRLEAPRHLWRGEDVVGQ